MSPSEAYFCWQPSLFSYFKWTRDLDASVNAGSFGRPDFNPPTLRSPFGASLQVNIAKMEKNQLKVYCYCNSINSQDAVADFHAHSSFESTRNSSGYCTHLQPDLFRHALCLVRQNHWIAVPSTLTTGMTTNIKLLKSELQRSALLLKPLAGKTEIVRTGGLKMVPLIS